MRRSGAARHVPLQRPCRRAARNPSMWQNVTSALRKALIFAYPNMPSLSIASTYEISSHLSPPSHSGLLRCSCECCDSGPIVSFRVAADCGREFLTHAGDAAGVRTSVVLGICVSKASGCPPAGMLQVPFRRHSRPASGRTPRTRTSRFALPAGRWVARAP